MIELAAQQATAAANLLAFGFGVALDADKFEAIGEGFNQAKAMGNISYVIIFDSKDNFLSAYNPDSLELETKRNGFKSEPQVSNGFIEKASPIKFMNSSYGTIVVGLSLKEVQKATIATLYVISFGAFSALTISVLISIIIAAKIVSPLQSVIYAMNQLSNRNLTGKCLVKTVDETATMSGKVNSAIESLRSSMSTVSSRTEGVFSSAEVLVNISDKMAKSADEMANNSKSVAKAIDEASKSISSVSTSTNIMATSIEVVAASIGELNTSLNEVANQCHKELTIAKGANQQVQNAREVMEQLGIAAKEISQIVSVINDIAGKTNLLALNATIEAANAGAAGKGFTIVAHEVKDLAKQTGEATQKIKLQIENMSEKTQKAINSISSINDVVQEIDSISQTIVAAVEEQSITVSEMAKNGNEASKSTNAISAAVSEWAKGMEYISKEVMTTNNAAQETAKGIIVIKENAGELSKHAEDLKGVVNTFTLS